MDKSFPVLASDVLVDTSFYKCTILLKVNQGSDQSYVCDVEFLFGSVFPIGKL